MTFEFDNRFDAIAIRYDELPKESGALQGLNPIVIFAEQGLTGAGLDRPTAAVPGNGEGAIELAQADFPGNSYKESARGQLTPLHQIHRAIFIIDHSGSMDRNLFAGSTENKLKYIQDRVSRLAADYLPDECNITLIMFDDQHDVTELLDVKSGAMQRLANSLGRWSPHGGTEFAEPLIAAKEVLQEDQTKLRAAGYPVDEEGVRSLVFFLTDGQDFHGRGPGVVERTMQHLRDLNAHCFVCGVGEDYDMSRIIGIASNAGASAWSHVPLEQNTLDVFDVQVPNILKQLRDCDHYFKLLAKGDVKGLSALTASTRFAIGSEIYNGYDQSMVDICFAGKKEATLTLEATRHVVDKDKYTLDIPIVDREDAIAMGKYEQVTQGQDHLQKYLLFRALVERDFDLLSKLVEHDPKLQEIFDQTIQEMRDARTHGYDNSHGSHSIHTSMTVTGMSMSQILPIDPFNSPKGKANKNPALETVNNADQGYTQAGMPLKPQQPEAPKAPQNPVGLHSGFVGPIDVPPGSSLPEPSKFDAKPYENAQPILSRANAILSCDSPIFVKNRQNTTQVKLDTVLHGRDMLIGRDTSAAARLHSDMVSRSHCVISYSDGKFLIVDKNSTNGTRLNGKKLARDAAPVEIKSGDIIKLANLPVIIFQVPDAVSST